MTHTNLMYNLTMERIPELISKMGRREVFRKAALGTAGSAIFVLGVVDRITTPTPENVTPDASVERLEFNIIYRLRSTLLLAVGAGIALGTIAAHFASRVEDR